MSKRLIGIDIGHHTLRVAILNREKSQVRVKDLRKQTFSGPQELAEQLRDSLAGEFRLGDQIVANLPTRNAYVRRLQFPFQNESKIRAAIPFELSTQLPVAIEDCSTAIQKPTPVDAGANVVAAAVPKAAIESLLENFEAAGLPLHRIDLAPYCYVASLGAQIGDGLLIISTEQDMTIALLQDGQLGDYRVLPSVAEQDVAGQAAVLLREIKVLAHAGGLQTLQISLMGGEKIEQIAEVLQGAGLSVNLLSLALGDRKVEAEFLPAVGLALKAQPERSDASFNFRRGDYQLKGEWANLKGKLVLLGVLLGTVVVLMAGSMTLKYLDKAQRAEQLQNEMVQVYRSLFPGATTIVDVPLQLQSAIRDLRAKNQLVSGSRASALRILGEVSKLPEQFAVEIEEFSMGPENLNLNGHAASFETVNQIAQALERSELFATAQVTDAKMSLDGDRIVFRLLMTYPMLENNQ
jgi:general secretion pathway protein L